MPSIQSYLVRYALRLQKWRHRFLTVPAHRRLIDNFGRRVPIFDGTKVTKLKVAGRLCEWVIPPDYEAQRVLLYFHGGAYEAGSLQSHRHLVSHIAAACRAKALMVDYRLAPEHPFPAAVEDASAVYQWLLTQASPQHIFMAGDSAGAGLTLACLQKLRSAALPMPCAALLMSPWVDLTAQHDSIERLADIDPLLNKPALVKCAQQYCGQHPATDPLISPIYADFHGFPPLLIQVGTLDMLLDEGKSLAARARAASVEVELEEWENMIHVWQILVGRLPESQQAIAQMAAFVERQANKAAQR